MDTPKVKSDKPKIKAVFSEIELIGRQATLRNDDGPDDGPITVIIDPDPGVTETITCTEMVCSSSRLPDFSIYETKFVLPAEMRLADTVTVQLRRSSRRK